jgi:hypothetical protein
VRVAGSSRRSHRPRPKLPSVDEPLTEPVEDLAGLLYGLLIMLEDRLGGEQAQLFHHFIEVGEYGLALEDIAGALAQDKIAITDQERSGMLALVRSMRMDDLVPHALLFCPRAPGADGPGPSGRE